ncbi:hypothetical protein Tco_1539131 [Tanacetum coccineum]
MSRIKEWNPIIDKFKKRLSKWKANMLSIGGRSTLITSVVTQMGSKKFLGSLGIQSKVKGGLGIGSLDALNLSLLQKWRWRFFNSPQALWVKVVLEIHGLYGTVGKDGSTTRFWRDAWLGDIPLERKFPRLFISKQTKIVLSETSGKMDGFGVGHIILMEELPVLN